MTDQVRWIPNSLNEDDDMPTWAVWLALIFVPVSTFALAYFVP